MGDEESVMWLMLQFRLLWLVTRKTVQLPPQETWCVNSKWPAWNPIGRRSWPVLKAAYWFVPWLKAMCWCKWKCVKELVSIFFFLNQTISGNTVSQTPALVCEWKKVPFHKTTHVQAPNVSLELHDRRFSLLEKMHPPPVLIFRNKMRMRAQSSRF